MFFWNRKSSIEAQILKREVSELRTQLSEFDSQRVEGAAQIVALSTKLEQIDREFRELLYEVKAAIDSLGTFETGIKSNRRLQQELDEALSVVDRIRGIIEHANKDDGLHARSI